MQDSGLLKVYTGFWFIQDSGLLKVYTGFRFIKGLDWFHCTSPT